jgi:hypothetical protein
VSGGRPQGRGLHVCTQVPRAMRNASSTPQGQSSLSHSRPTRGGQICVMLSRYHNPSLLLLTTHSGAHFGCKRPSHAIAVLFTPLRCWPPWRTAETAARPQASSAQSHTRLCGTLCSQQTVRRHAASPSPPHFVLVFSCTSPAHSLPHLLCCNEVHTCMHAARPHATPAHHARRVQCKQLTDIPRQLVN